MIENLQFSFGFLVVSIIAYLALRSARPNADRSQEMAIDLSISSATNLLFWLLLYMIAQGLQDSTRILNTLNLVLDTRVIFVPWAFLSYGLVSLGFQLNRVSNGHVDWRIAVTSLVIGITAILGIYYYSTGIQVLPLSIP